MAPKWAAEYVGMETGEAGVDCWRLACRVLKERYGTTMPLFEDVTFAGTTRGEMAAAIRSRMPLVKARSIGRIEDAEPGDLVLMNLWGYPIHVGVVVSGSEMIHADPWAGVVVERMDSTRIAPRIEGVYRVN